MDQDTRKILQKTADTIRVLAAEGVEKATCGHPGLPLGCAEIGAYLYTHQLRHHPRNPNWYGRDRFVLSAGHGSMFLYSLLHLTGYDLPIEQLKNFRQLHSMTPGHPEYGEAPGVETTTGPLGQGIAAATGMAIALKILGCRFGESLFDAKVFALAGDGCIMEGISSEASSLAGHLKLNNLVLIYDSNDICLDGPISECLSEDTGKRYESYGFKVIRIDGHDFDQIENAFETARNENERPVIIIAKTIIGKGAPTKQGTSACHGARLGQEEVDALKKILGWPTEAFHVPPEVTQYMQQLQDQFADHEKSWNDDLEMTLGKDPDLRNLWMQFRSQAPGQDFEDQIWDLEIQANKATRAQSQAIIAKVAELLPYFYTGSADLSCSDSSNIKWSGSITAEDWTQRNIKFGVREFAMAASCYGIALTQLIRPLCATFMTFSDYMRNAIRLSALMKQKVLFQFTHDSVFLGEDGPTHQPVEHYAALRAIPNLAFIRPCDGNELKAAWIEAIKFDGPVAFSLSRQGLPDQGELTRQKARKGVARGGYILYGNPDPTCKVLICATGSEVSIAMGVAEKLEAAGQSVRVVSIPCWEFFDEQDNTYQDSVLGGNFSLRVAIEAGIEMGWHKYTGRDGLVISMHSYGASAPEPDIREEFGFTVEKIMDQISNRLPVAG
jgi:transketolase